MKDDTNENHDDVMMFAWDKVVKAYAAHVGKGNMNIIMLRNDTDKTPAWEAKLSTVIDDMNAAKGGICPKYSESEVYDFYSEEGMHLLFPYYNMHFVFPETPEESQRYEGFTRVRAYGNSIAINQIINANMETD